MTRHLLRYEPTVTRAAELLARELLDSRQSLPKAANCRPVLPTDPTARRFHGQLVDGTVLAFMPFLSLLHNNADLGMPLSELQRPVRMLERYVERWALTRAIADHPLAIPVRRETRAQSVFDLCELEAVQHGDDPQVLKASIAAGRHQITATEDVVVACERRLVSLTGSTS